MGSNNSKTSTEEVDKKNFQEWIQACGENDIKRVEELIKKNKHKYYETNKAKEPSPLHVCIQSPKITKILLDSGIPVNLESPITLSTPLHFAAFHNAQETTKILLENGADTMKFDFDDVHPYLYARERNSYKSMFHLRKAMIENNKGADFIKTWRQVCRPELMLVQSISEEEKSERYSNAMQQLENCVGFSFCLPEKLSLEESSNMNSKEVEEKYIECLNKNGVKF